MKLYGVVTMDLVGSRKINERQVFQEKLKGYIDIINEKYCDSLVAKISFTLGDEWQLISKRPQECYNIVHDFQKLLWEDEISFYAGIGIGELETGIYEDTRMMDGSCFIMAREAINVAKEASKKRSKFIYSKGNRVFFKSIMDKALLHNLFTVKNHHNIYDKACALDEEVAIDLDGYISLDDMINIIIENNEILKNRLTDKQKRIYIDYINYKSYRRIIEENKDKLRETVGGISQKLNNAEYFTIQRNHAMVASLLNLLVFSNAEIK